MTATEETRTMRRLPVLIAILTALALVSGAAAQEKPRSGGVLNWYVYGDPGRLDIHLESPLSVQQALAGIYSGLLHRDPDDPDKITGDLAERWTVSGDGKVYTFHLRKGVKWHDGQPFTSADVKATLDRVLSPSVKSPRCGSMLKPVVASVEAVDPHTVQIALKFPAAPFLEYTASAWCRIAAKHVLEKYGDLSKPEAQIGTGPFKFKRYERGSVIEWEKNKDYFLPGLPYLDGVKQYVLVGFPTQLAAAKAGRVMLWDTWPPMKKTDADELRRARGNDVDITQNSINTIFLAFMHTEKPPFDKPDMRRAVHLALDRQEIVAKALEGAGIPCAILDPKLAGEYALPIEEVNKLPGCRQPKDQDIAEAKRLVEKHYPNGVDVEAAVRSVGNYVDRAQLILSQLRKIGIRGTIKTYESAAGFAVFGKGDFVFLPTQDRAMVTVDPGDLFSLVYTTDAGSNWGKWKDKKADDLTAQGLQETNPAKRKQIYWELQRHLLSGAPSAIPIAWVEGFHFVDKKVRGHKFAPTVYDNNTFLKVWLAQ
jgi:peptide/nickel transport system substrate-binding protein